ncbi:MAG: leucine-rich repeat domain-containing protein [Pseudomonadota bacterium]
MAKKLATLTIVLLFAAAIPFSYTYVRGLSDFATAEERIEAAVASGKAVLDFSDLAYLQKVPASIHRIEKLWHFRASSAKRLSNIDALAGLKNIRNLQLADTRVTDLSPLARLPGLEVLDIRDTWVADLAPLAAAPKLRWLQMNGTAVKSLCPLNKVSRLAWLNVHKSYSEDGSQDCYNALKRRVAELNGGTAFQQNYIPGDKYKRKVAFDRFLQKIEWL